MDFIRTLLEQQPLMALFLTIALGYIVGEINIKGFSLGVGTVLFVALGIGWFAPKSAPAPMLGTFGLALFLYTVGIQYGTQFFIGLTSPSGLMANLLALIGVLAAGAVTILFITMADLKAGYGLGLFAGSGTSTPAMQAAIATLHNDDPAVGYSVAYPFGVAGPILFLYLAFIFLKPKIDVRFSRFNSAAAFKPRKRPDPSLHIECQSQLQFGRCVQAAKTSERGGSAPLPAGAGKRRTHRP